MKHLSAWQGFAEEPDSSAITKQPHVLKKKNFENLLADIREQYTKARSSDKCGAIKEVSMFHKPGSCSGAHYAFGETSHSA